MKVKLRDAITKSKIVKYEIKPALYATQCDCCKKVYQMNKWCNDRFTPGELHGTFECKEVHDPDTGENLGNVFFASVCSFACAEEIFNGGWRNMEKYKPFSDIATLARVELGITVLLLEENDLIRLWEKL